MRCSPTRPTACSSVALRADWRFDNNAQSFLAVIILYRAENPDTRIVHLNDGIGPLRGGEIDHVNRLCDREWVAVQGHDIEMVPRQCQSDWLGRAGIKQAEENALAVADPNRIAVPEHSAVKGDCIVHDFKAVIGRR